MPSGGAHVPSKIPERSLEPNKPAQCTISWQVIFGNNETSALAASESDSIELILISGEDDVMSGKSSNPQLTHPALSDVSSICNLPEVP